MNESSETLVVTEDEAAATPVLAVKQEVAVEDGNDSDCMVIEGGDEQLGDAVVVVVENGRVNDKIITIESDDVAAAAADDNEYESEPVTAADTAVATDTVAMELETEINISDNTSSVALVDENAILNDEFDNNIDAAELEILDERVEKSINAEIEKEAQIVAEAAKAEMLKVTNISEENGGSKISGTITTTITTATAEDNSTNTSSSVTAAKSITSTNVIRTTSSNDKKNVEGCRNLWVCNIPTTTRANDLKQMFAKYGKVIGAKIVVNTRSPGAKCYGYVTMDTEKDADNCIRSLNNSDLKGRKITIEKVSSEHDVASLSSRRSRKSVDTTKNDENGKKDRKETSSRSHSVRKSVSLTRDVKGKSKETSKEKDVVAEKVKAREKTRVDWEKELSRERDRLVKQEERMRREMQDRQKQMEKRFRDEERRLERDREDLRREREKLENEKAELWKMEREKAKLERERLEREKEELRRQKKMLEEEAKRAMKRAPSPPTIRSTKDIGGGGGSSRRDRDRDEPMPPKRRYDAADYDRSPNTTSSAYNKYESEAAAYIARMERESRCDPLAATSGNRGNVPKDLRYTLMETASYRNSSGIEMPVVTPPSMERKNRDHRYMDDLPKDHHRPYERNSGRSSSPGVKFPAMQNSTQSSSGGWRPVSGSVQQSKMTSPPSEVMRWTGNHAGGGRMNSNSSMYPSNGSVSGSSGRSGSNSAMVQSPWASTMCPPGTEYMHGTGGGGVGNNNYQMGPFDNYKNSSLNRNKY